MKSLNTFRTLYYISALYDGLLGLAFLIAGAALFNKLNITPPNHMGYVHFPAALLIVFASLFFAIAQNPIKNQNLIPFGILLKVCYCSVVSYHWLTSNVPTIWKPFVILDLMFLAMFIWSAKAIKSLTTQHPV